uniref:Helicase C-terminal domain-containing protein n=1 Tax=Zosterops lateralis melanops TaxID=1220523 RepID=A0A8D2QLA9_ZOSLA
LIFCNTASTVNWLGYILDDHKIKHLRLQGQMSAAARAGIFASFQKGEMSVLVCTDLASRGLDTSGVQLVVNYDFPDTLQDYLHRAGRVGRVGSTAPGAVVSFVTHRWDVDLVRKIETAARKRTGLPGMDSIDKPLPKGGGKKKPDQLQTQRTKGQRILDFLVMKQFIQRILDRVPVKYSRNEKAQ